MKKVFIIIPFMLALFCSKPVDEATADKVFEEALAIGQASGEPCLRLMTSKKIMAEAREKHGVSESAMVTYMRSEKGKVHMGRKMLSCIQKARESTK